MKYNSQQKILMFLPNFSVIVYLSLEAILDLFYTKTYLHCVLEWALVQLWIITAAECSAVKWHCPIHATNPECETVYIDAKNCCHILRGKARFSWC